MPLRALRDLLFSTIETTEARNMPTVPTPRRRSIGMTTTRSRQLALAAATLGLSSELTIQSFITAGLLSLAAHDRAFAMALARSAGMTWDDLAEADSTDVLARLMP